MEVEQSPDLILPHMFRLLLRSPADIVMVGRPPWLTAGRVSPILAGAMLLTIAALAWVGPTAQASAVPRHSLCAPRRSSCRPLTWEPATRCGKRMRRNPWTMDSNRILELIARDEPVDLIVDHIAEAVALHCEGAVCAILLGAPHGPRVCVVPAMPAGWLDALDRIPWARFRAAPRSAPPRVLRRSRRGWISSIRRRMPRFRTFCSAPIVVDGATAGVIAAFFRDEKGSALEGCAGAQLGLWCNIAALALERRRLHDQLSYRAQHDGLTGLPNRALLYERLEAEIERASSCAGLLGVIYIDLDGFKQINDTYGHDAGDAVLKRAASRMTHVRAPRGYGRAHWRR